MKNFIYILAFIGLVLLIGLASAGTPTANFSTNTSSGVSPLTVLFNDTTTGTNLTTWAWNFSDGSANVTTQNTTHTFINIGIYPVNLTAGNVSGNNTTSKNVSVLPPAPTVTYHTNATFGIAPVNISYYDDSTGANSWKWTFGDGNNTTLENTNHTFYTTGWYTTSLNATNTTNGTTNSYNLTKTNQVYIASSAYDSEYIWLSFLKMFSGW